MPARTGETSGAIAAMRRARARIRARRGLGLIYRAAVALVGAAIVLTGVVLLPLPGPGWVIIFLGLGVLATEFEWARRLLRFARRQVGGWTAWVTSRSLGVRVLLGLATLVIVAGCVAGYLAWQGVPGWAPYIG